MAAGAWAVHAQGRASRVSATLEPAQEVPAVSSPQAGGSFAAVIDDAGEAIDYQLTFSGLQANVRMSHIHMAQPAVNGAIIVWLCGTTDFPGPAGTQRCPQAGTVTGTIEASDLQLVPSQGIEPGDFQELVEGLRNGLTYVTSTPTRVRAARSVARFTPGTDTDEGSIGQGMGTGAHSLPNPLRRRARASRIA